MTEPARISAADVKRLRDITGAGMMDCKQALTETGGDLDKAQEILRAKGKAGLEKRLGRAATEGVVDAYVHGEGRIGALVEVNCETDFVARTEEFRKLAREIAMQVAAREPRWVSRPDVPPETVELERKIAGEQLAERLAGKPEQVVARAIEGKLDAFYKETVLLDQAYIREDSRTVGDLVGEVAAQVGENVVVRRFARFKLGEQMEGE